MNKKSFFRIAMLAGVISIAVIGCTQNDPDDDITTLPRDKFIGTWSVTSHHSDPNQAATQYWTLVIEPASAAAAEQVVMKNFDQTGTDKTVYADVDGNDLHIPSTVVYLTGGGQQTIEGSGHLNGATLSFTYTSFDGLVTDSATATATK
jgi:hypothetical protein